MIHRSEEKSTGTENYKGKRKQSEWKMMEKRAEETGQWNVSETSQKVKQVEEAVEGRLNEKLGKKREDVKVEDDDEHAVRSIEAVVGAVVGRNDCCWDCAPARDAAERKGGKEEELDEEEEEELVAGGACAGVVAGCNAFHRHSNNR